MNGRRLPIGIQTFRKLRDDGCYYVDKTALIHRLTAEGSHYFPSRPRRFGKSLLLDTLNFRTCGVRRHEVEASAKATAIRRPLRI